MNEQTRMRRETKRYVDTIFGDSKISMIHFDNRNREIVCIKIYRKEGFDYSNLDNIVRLPPQTKVRGFRRVS